MSDNANGSDALVSFAAMPKRYDSETPTVKIHQQTVQSQAQFERKIGVCFGGKSCLRRHGQDHHDMPQGGE
jgi:hypothetical protein